MLERRKKNGPAETMPSAGRASGAETLRGSTRLATAREKDARPKRRNPETMCGVPLVADRSRNGFGVWLFPFRHGIAGLARPPRRYETEHLDDQSRVKC